MLRDSRGSFEVIRKPQRTVSTDSARLTKPRPKSTGDNESDGVPQRSSSFLSSALPKRSSSALSRMRSSILGSSRIPLSPPSPTPSTGSQSLKEEDNRDVLPEDRPSLEARLNYHIAELERLREYVMAMNGLIEDQARRIASVAARPDVASMEVSRYKQKQIIDISRTARNSYGKFIGYHRIEIERIITKGLKVMAAHEERLRIPEIAKNLMNQYAWQELFLI